MGSWDPEKGSKGKKKKTDSSYECEKPWIPWLLPTIVLANIIIFVLMMYTNNCPKNNKGSKGKCVARYLGRFSFQPSKENPLFGPSSNTMDKWGALQWSKVVHGKQGWRFITCLWLHGGLIHLFANVLSFVFIGIRHEQQFGYVRVGVIYLLSGFGGGILSSLFMQHTTTVGASGALFGLIGAMCSEFLTNWTIYTYKVTAVTTFIAIIVLNLAVGVLPHIDNFANIGGFFTGFLLGFVLLFRPQSGWINPQHRPAGAAVIPKYKPYQYVFCVIVAVLLLIVGFGMGLLLVFKGANGNKHCSWCHHLTCAPTSKWPCGY
ncbi:hypothetical protein ES288_D12G266800v1 [Gossypium darwinii]|uniref:RHOMBOID-like protein n=1 Tax=Gossypium darwinii TaxID=34276 RepID=A0A5D2ADN7_GOSDA|nr:hypothetical protein ES288_D12G266800v1 [Gossypium darwinii]